MIRGREKGVQGFGGGGGRESSQIELCNLVLDVCTEHGVLLPLHPVPA